MIARSSLFSLIIATLAGCGEAPTHQTATTLLPASGWFTNEAAQRGVSFTYHSGASEAYQMTEIMGGGAALLDVDSDGDLDLLLVGGNPTDGSSQHALLENDGAGSFTSRSFHHATAYGMGVATGDHDGDGDVDVLITTMGEDVLLSNDGTGTFTDITGTVGLSGAGWSTSATFFDADRDGDLDLYICRYLDWSPELPLECFNTMGGRDYCSPRNFMAATADRLLLYDARSSRYIDASVTSGIAAKPGTGLGVIAIDANSDGWMDLFVANDGMPDRLWINNHDGTFTDRAWQWGCAVDIDGRASAGMGVAAGDIDHDGDEDLIVGNLRNESDGLFRNESSLHFLNTSTTSGLAAANRRFTRFGMGWHDFDHDGELDLLQATGRVMRQGNRWGDDPYAEPNLFFAGGGSGFTLLGTPAQSPTPATSRGAAFGDVDGDGDIDVLIINRDAPASLLINTASTGSSVIIRLLDRDGGPAIGATITAVVGDRTLTRRVRTDGSYLSASSPDIHLGLGEADHLDNIEIRWPDGSITTKGPVAADGVVEIRQDVE